MLNCTYKKGYFRFGDVSDKDDFMDVFHGVSFPYAFSYRFVLQHFFSNSLTIHQVKTQENHNRKRGFGYPVLISIDFDDLTSPFSP